MPQPTGPLSRREAQALIVVRTAAPASWTEPKLTEARNGLYAERLRVHGAKPSLLTANATDADRADVSSTHARWWYGSARLVGGPLARLIHGWAIKCGSARCLLAQWAFQSRLPARRIVDAISGPRPAVNRA
jgi:hypothetical protein